MNHNDGFIVFKVICEYEPMVESELYKCGNIGHCPYNQVMKTELYRNDEGIADMIAVYYNNGFD